MPDGYSNVLDGRQYEYRDRRDGKPKRLLIVVNDFGFFVSHRLVLAKAAHSAGWSVHIATPFESVKRGELPAFLKHHFLPISRGGTNPCKDLRTFISLFHIYRSVRPTVVHNVTIKPIVYGGIAARLVRIPGVVAAVSGLGYVFTKSAAPSMLKRLLMSLFRVALDHPNSRVIFQNPDDRLALVSAGAVRSEQVVMIRGSGVDISEFRVSVEPEGIPTVLMTARLLREKGVIEFAQAARMIKREMPCRFLLAGGLDPANPSALRLNDLRPWIEDGSIEWLGHRTDIPHLLRQCHVYVLPSYYGEGVPKSLIEAAASGRALITTDMPGCREVVTNGENGLLIPPRNSYALAEAIRKLLRDGRMRLEMGIRSRKLSETTFSVDQVVRRHLEIYEDLLALV